MYFVNWIYLKVWCILEKVFVDFCKFKVIYFEKKNLFEDLIE